MFPAGAAGAGWGVARSGPDPRHGDQDAGGLQEDTFGHVGADAGRLQRGAVGGLHGPLALALVLCVEKLCYDSADREAGVRVG